MLSHQTEVDFGPQIQRFKSLWHNDRPLARAANTGACRYLYDTGTNKILECQAIEHALLDGFIKGSVEDSFSQARQQYGDDLAIRSAAENILELIQKEKLLRLTKATKFGLSAHFRNIDDLINKNLWILTLEVTEKCNLRCGYCVYNPGFQEKRNHGNRNMSESVAWASIDYLKAHSANRDEVSIVFYGGEPLLRMKLIASSVSYAKRIMPGKNIVFSVTTNATLITPSVADYLFKKGFTVLASVDGPEEIHNAFRKKPGGKGSFEDATRGLRNLYDAYGEKFVERVRLSIVYGPPYSSDRIARIYGLWDELPWLPKDIGVQITYPTPGTVQDENLSTEDKDLSAWAQEKYYEAFKDKGEADTISKSIVEMPLAILYKRPVYQDPPEEFALNGCCIPAQRRLYVDVTGNFHLCERISSEAPTIGDVSSGIDIDLIKRLYIDEYARTSLPSCSTCWAIRLCNTCYMFAFHRSELDLIKKQSHCQTVRSSREQHLKLFLKLHEVDPHRLDRLRDFRLI